MDSPFTFIYWQKVYFSAISESQTSKISNTLIMLTRRLLEQVTNTSSKCEASILLRWQLEILVRQEAAEVRANPGCGFKGSSTSPT